MRLASSAASLITALLLAPPLAAQADTTVALRFGWATGTSARVEVEKVRVRRTAARVDSIRSRFAHTWKVEAHPEGRRVAWADFAWVEVPDLPGGDGFLRNVTQAIHVLPAYIVKPDGALARVEDLAQARTLLGAMFTRVIAANMRDTPPGALEVLEQVTPDRVLEALAQQEWEAQVGMWVGVEVTPGEEITGTVQEPSPLNPALAIPTRLAFAMGKRVPCTPGAAEARCVEMRLTSSPEPEPFRRALVDAVTQMGATAGQAEAAARDAVKETRVDAVVEPATLRPHRVTVVQTLRLVEPTPGGGAPRPVSQVDRKTYSYTWDK
ncbi:MAG TPA: hypothetical protein VHG91_05635 [Longimicrobium sp.]|nr:hypothetical protein [Longimicrobium sp.]